MSNRSDYLFTSESVSEGHPDKVCDRISDAVVDLYLDADPHSRVACETLVTTNRIFRGRTEGVGALTAEEALAWGWTGPCLRACGVPYDLRRARPYLGYENYEFDVPVGQHGDRDCCHGRSHHPARRRL